jgi:hypothetical protein
MVNNGITARARSGHGRRAIGRLIGGATACALLLFGVAALGSATALANGHAPARHAAPEILTSPPSTQYSANWSGYVLSGESGYNVISATWRVPSVGVTSAFSDSDTWIGFDGVKSDDLLQAGTEQGYRPGTGAFYDAWWQVSPGAQKVKFNVKPGDNIVVSIQQVTTEEWQIYLADTNTGQSFVQIANYYGPVISAEYIEEAPTINGSVVPFAHVTPVAFYNVRSGGTTPPLLPGEAVGMIQNGNQVATSSVPNQANNGFTVRYGATRPAAPPTTVFQTHSNGSVWASTSTPCNSTGCPGWREIDNNPAESQVTAGDGSVYELHSSGSVWMWTGGLCTSSTVCPGWVQVGYNATTKKIVAGSGNLFALLSDGSIWLYLGVPCQAGSCGAWTELDNNPATTDITAGGNTLYQLHSDGSIWEWTGDSCNAGSCGGWKELDDNPATVEISGNTDTVFQLHNDGSVWQSTGAPCAAGACSGWIKRDNNPLTTAISAGGDSIYTLRSDGSVWRSLDICSPQSCPAWNELDNNPATTGITASMTTVYEMRGASHSIWRSTGTACSAGSCPGWVELDDNLSTSAISAQHSR